MYILATAEVETDPPSRIIGWACEGCGKVGAITLRGFWDTWGVIHDVENDHAVVSPLCESIAQYPRGSNDT